MLRVRLVQIAMLAFSAAVVTAVNLVAYYFIYTAHLSNIPLAIGARQTSLTLLVGLLFFVPQIVQELMRRPYKPYPWTWFWLGGLFAVHNLTQPVIPMAARGVISESPFVAYALQSIFVIGYAAAFATYLDLRGGTRLIKASAASHVVIAAIAVSMWLGLWHFIQWEVLGTLNVQHLAHVSVMPAGKLWGMMSEPLGFASCVAVGLISGALLALPLLVARLKTSRLMPDGWLLLAWSALYCWFTFLIVNRSLDSYLTSYYTTFEVGFLVLLIALALLSRPASKPVADRAGVHALLYVGRFFVAELAVLLILALYVWVRYQLIFAELKPYTWS